MALQDDALRLAELDQRANQLLKKETGKEFFRVLEEYAKLLISVRHRMLDEGVSGSVKSPMNGILRCPLKRLVQPSGFTKKPEASMLTQEDYWMIQELHQQGVYRGDIAERLGMHRKTVGRALERGGPPSSKRRRER